MSREWRLLNLGEIPWKRTQSIYHALALVQEDLKTRIKVESMSEIERLPLGDVNDEVASIIDLGIPAIMLFGIPSQKDEAGSSAFDDNGIVQKAIS
ncbi:MAG: hypothetical protein KGD64_13170, partial [Candidatus Heimdallarchaeota archaeon]|nr:hypothetical protein [Candidatus Heimdallarchaeota archaeon]